MNTRKIGAIIFGIGTLIVVGIDNSTKSKRKILNSVLMNNKGVGVTGNISYTLYVF
ncbi:hypothetical protein [Bacillus solimangrovi]|uniref:hypothetical protein n=1 Tax=Bacillus solimangrovi TaxID=1305675 RepID=UPI0015864B19|nr:hypothetical protein [Bacillus solimangrovi]